MELNNSFFDGFAAGAGGKKIDNVFTGAIRKKSHKIVMWKSEEKKTSCAKCRGMNGRTFVADEFEEDLPVHPNCVCRLEDVTAYRAGTLTKQGVFGLDNIFITCDDFGKRDIINSGSNYENDRLPKKDGRHYYIIDVSGEPMTKLIVSNDGLCFGTRDGLNTIFPIESFEGESFKKESEEESFIKKFDKELDMLEKGELAPMAYTYIMRNVYAWYLNNSAAERTMIILDFN